MQKHFATLL